MHETNQRQQAACAALDCVKRSVRQALQMRLMVSVYLYTWLPVCLSCSRWKKKFKFVDAGKVCWLSKTLEIMLHTITLHTYIHTCIQTFIILTYTATHTGNNTHTYIYISTVLHACMQLCKCNKRLGYRRDLASWTNKHTHTAKITAFNYFLAFILDLLITLFAGASISKKENIFFRKNRLTFIQIKIKLNLLYQLKVLLLQKSLL